MQVKVKICGITNLADARAAAEAGADVLGFVFYDKSPRFISCEAAAAITRELPPFVIKAGVFVNAPEDAVLRAIRECGLNLLQFHGEETPDYCLQFGIMSMKAFRVRDAASLQALRDYPTDAWLLDAYAPDKLGGTGEAFNWDLAREAQSWGRPIFLAGGLDAGERRRSDPARPALRGRCFERCGGCTGQERPRSNQSLHPGRQAGGHLKACARRGEWQKLSPYGPGFEADATLPSKSVVSTCVALSGTTVFITPVPSLCSHLRAPVFASRAMSNPFLVP